jgi:hypothetical protein
MMDVQGYDTQNFNRIVWLNIKNQKISLNQKNLSFSIGYISIGLISSRRPIIPLQLTEKRSHSIGQIE